MLESTLPLTDESNSWCHTRHNTIRWSILVASCFFPIVVNGAYVIPQPGGRARRAKVRGCMSHPASTSRGTTTRRNQRGTFLRDVVAKSSLHEKTSGPSIIEVGMTVRVQDEPLFDHVGEHEDYIKPRLLVFDLDNTLWTPELYQIRKPGIPRANRDIWLFDDAKQIVADLANNPFWTGIALGIASRTHKMDIARALMDEFEAVPGMTLSSLFPHREIVRGSKRAHFERLKEATGVPFGDMVFFDDDARLNLREIETMGVLCCHCPRGLTTDLFRGTIQTYHEMKTLAGGGSTWMGTTVTSKTLGLAPSAGDDDDEGRITRGRMKFYSPVKRFGFVKENGPQGKEFFVHESKVADGLVVKTGMLVEFETLQDSKGRPAAAILKVVDGGAVGRASGKNSRAGQQRKQQQGMNSVSPSAKNKGRDGDVDMVEMPVFSMSQPFASLLLNGVKTVETRNNPMFMELKPGTKVLLHCGQRDWKDQETPIIQMRKAGMPDDDIRKLSALPRGFRRGSVIGVLEVGKTWLTTAGERRRLERSVVATEGDMGKYATRVTSAHWLKKTVSIRGGPGIYRAKVAKSALPSDMTSEDDAF